MIGNIPCRLCGLLEDEHGMASKKCLFGPTRYVPYTVEDVAFVTGRSVDELFGRAFRNDPDTHPPPYWCLVTPAGGLLLADIWLPKMRLQNLEARFAAV